MQEVGLQDVDVLKMDIEGAEHEVLRALIKGSIRPRILCVELDAPTPARRTSRYCVSFAASATVCRVSRIGTFSSRQALEGRTPGE